MKKGWNSKDRSSYSPSYAYHSVQKKFATYQVIGRTEKQKNKKKLDYTFHHLATNKFFLKNYTVGTDLTKRDE